MKSFRKTENLARAIFLLVFISLFIVVFAPNNSIFYKKTLAEEVNAEEELNKNVYELIQKLDLQALQEYVNGLENFEGKNVGERLVAYIKGDAFNYENFAREFLSVLFQDVSEILPAFACIAAIALMSGLISSLRGEGAGKTAGKMIYLISYIAALLPLIGVLGECFTKSLDCVSALQKQMQLTFPLLLTLMATSGGALSVAVCRPTVAFFSTAIVSIITKIVFPLTLTIIAFSMAGNLTKELKIGKFTAFFKSINKWIIGVCISVFGIFFTLQGITSARYDGIVRRAAKYAIGNGVPIVGGFLSGGFDLAVAGSVLIRNSLGSMSIFLMAAVLFEPLVLLFSINLLLRFTSAITQPFGDSRISDFLEETAGNLHYCTAGLLFVAFLYFLSILLMVTSAEALL